MTGGFFKGIDEIQENQLPMNTTVISHHFDYPLLFIKSAVMMALAASAFIVICEIIL